MDRLNGIMAIDKPSGITSHGLVLRLRRITGQKRTGHTGTLDPTATGLMLVCFGTATKLSQFLTAWDKSYSAEITLGAVSNTQDSEGIIEETGPIPELTDEELCSLLDGFVGEMKQEVPQYSAAKVKGKRLHRYARDGENVDRPIRDVVIHSMRLISYDKPILKIETSCSKGTYIRVLAEMIGNRIGCGAYLSGLRRLGVGPYRIDDAVDLDEFKRLYDEHLLNGNLKTIEDVLEFPVIRLCKEAAARVKHGERMSSKNIISCGGDFKSGDYISMASETGKILAVAKSNCDAVDLKHGHRDEFFSYVRVFS